MRTSVLLCLLWAGLAVVCVAAQPDSFGTKAPGWVGGTVEDYWTGEPLVGASILLEGTEACAATDVNGSFLIGPIRAGSYTARGKYTGYRDDRHESTYVCPGCTTRVKMRLRLSPAEESLRRVVKRPRGPVPRGGSEAGQRVRARLPASSDSRLSKHGGCIAAEMSLLAIKQVGDSVLIQTIGPRLADMPNWNGPSIKEGIIPIAEFRTFWDSLSRLGFWQLNDKYEASASRTGEEGGSISVGFETPSHRKTTKTVRFFAPGSCFLEFQKVYYLFESMARFARTTPDWKTLMGYQTEEPIAGLKDLYHAEALQAIAVSRDSQDLDTLLSMLRRNDEYAAPVVRGLGSIGNRRAVPDLEKFLAMQEVRTHARDTRGKEALALAAAKVLVALNGRQSVPAIRRYLSTSYHRSVIDGWCGLLASVGDYSMVPEVLQIFEDSSRYRGVYVGEAAETLKRIGYKSRHVISALLQAAQSELRKDNPDNGTMAAYLSTLRVLTGQEFSYHPEDSLGVKRSNLARWLKWWKANARRFPAGGKNGLLQINSTPSDVEIWLDGANTGRMTPFLMFDAKAGKHSLRLAKEGYSDWSSSVTVTPERATNVNPVLSKDCGSLRVLSTPLAAAFLDGSSLGRYTPKLFDSIASGKHRIRLFKLGYLEWDSMVTVTQGETTTVRAILKPAR